ncbi:hypothetical protein [Phytobacter sp. RSE-02]|uniref:gp53-like domain-containing protein n=1 Tax=Phytobacter sp. RSE-02 TaxID=3229229 RepID=UPI00339D514D
MATNNFKPFATGTGANVTPQADYEALTALATGFQSGKASSAQVNKAIRQSTFIAAGVAQFILNKLSIDVLDDGDLLGFVTDFDNALNYSPTFTGDPRAPTPAPGDNDTSIATTAFVQAVATALLGGAPTNLNTLKKLADAIGDDPAYYQNVNAALNLKANLASPALTGTPTAPTAAAGTNTTQIATTQFIQSIITALLDGAPTTLNTLNKLASAIGNDPTYSANVNAALATKAPVASPALTGTPTAPTAAAGNSSTLLATTAFVAAALTAFLPKRSFAGSDFIRIPDVPGGLILQWGTTAGTGSDGLITATLPTTFPNGNGICAVCAYYNGTRNAITTQVASITQTTIQLFASSAVSGAAAASAQIRYFVLGY